MSACNQAHIETDLHAVDEKPLAAMEASTVRLVSLIWIDESS